MKKIYLFILICVTYLTSCAKLNATDYVVNGVDTLQLGQTFDSTYEVLVAEVDNYIHQRFPSSELNADFVVDYCLGYNLDLCFVLAQGQCESGFGTMGMARRTNSVWNVGACDSKGHEDIHHGFKYEHPDSSLCGYVDLLYRNYLVGEKTTNDLLEEYVDCNGKRYASSLTYEATLQRTYNNIKRVTNIYDLQSKMFELIDIYETIF